MKKVIKRFSQSFYEDESQTVKNKRTDSFSFKNRDDSLAFTKKSEALTCKNKKEADLKGFS